jgi:hypothetical protein
VLFLILHLLLFFLLSFYIPLISFCFVSSYAIVRNVGTEVVHKSVREGLGQSVKKSDVLTREEEQVVLKSAGVHISHPRGLNSRMGYFFCRNFFIRGQNELGATNANQFQLHVNKRGDEYLR